MADTISRADRSLLMSKVRSKDTKPEIQVRSILHRMGYRFRLHRRDLPGSPDIVLPRHSKAIFVHGCFWHNHDCSRGRRPNSNTDYWNDKLNENVVRDGIKAEELAGIGWYVLTVWECELRQIDVLIQKIDNFMTDQSYTN